MRRLAPWATLIALLVPFALAAADAASGAVTKQPLNMTAVGWMSRLREPVAPQSQSVKGESDIR